MFDRLHTEPVYNTRAVVQRTGVPADTFRAWERRYNFPSPCRTDGNQRLYSEQDVAIICWLRDQTRAGMTISHAISLYRSLLRVNASVETPVESQDDPARTDRDLTERPPAARLTSTGPRPSYFHTCLELITALSSFDASAAEKIVEEAVGVAPVESVCHEVLRPAMTEIKRRLAGNGLTGSTERFAHAFILRKIYALFDRSHPEQGKGPVVAAGVEGDHEELELLHAALFLSRAGFSVIYLGADLTIRELRQAIEPIRPALVILGASSDRAITALAQAVDALRENVREGDPPPIAFLGDIFSRRPELQRRIDAPFLGGDGYEAIAACERLLARFTSRS